jgi:MFS family permease
MSHILRVSLVSFLNALGAGLISPVLPLYAAEFSVDLTHIGLAVSAHSLANAAFSLPGGVLSDKLRARDVARLGQLSVFLGALGAGLAPIYPVLLGARILQGIGISLFQMSAMVWIGRNIPSQGRGKANSIFWGATSMGFASGPAIGGFLAAEAGLRTPFFFHAGLVAVGGVLILKLLAAETAPPVKDVKLSEHVIGGFKILTYNRHIPILGVATLMYYFVRSGMGQAVLPLYGYYNLLLDPPTVGLVLAATSFVIVLVMIPMGSYSDKHGRRTITQLSALAGLAAMILLPTTNDLTSFITVMILFGVSTAAISFASAWASDILPQEKMGLGLGIFRVMLELGIGLGPVGLSTIASIGRSPGQLALSPLSFFTSAGLMLTVAVILFLVRDPIRILKGREPAKI